MFKNIQNRLLLTNPILWNLKIVPFALATIIFHIIFFVLGYADGAIDFTETDSNFRNSSASEIIIFTGILISLITFVIWIVAYSRNNGFKTFYPKKNNSLFKEWLFILLFCVLNVTYTVSFLYASDLRARNYFSEEEINRRCEVIAMSSLFLEGSFKEPDYIMVPNEKTPDAEDMISIPRDSFDYDQKKYSLKSLINKNIDNFSIFSNLKKDSINEATVKTWLIENKKDAVKNLFDEYFKILKEHQLPSNITADQWLQMVYNPPTHTGFVNIGRIEREKRYDYGYEYYEGVQTHEAVEAAVMVDSSTVASFDSIAKTVKIINGTEYIYSKYYVSHNALLRSYGSISNSWDNPHVNTEMLLGFLYFSIFLSLAVFSFKVTSGRNWLIALVSLGIVGIVTGIITVIVRYSNTFPIIIVLIFVGLVVYFTLIRKTKSTKGISGITLNQMLWLLPTIFPMVYFGGLDIAKDISGYHFRYDTNGNEFQKIEQFPKIDWLTDHSLHFLGLHILIVIVMMFVLSRHIKKWRGIAES